MNYRLILYCLVFVFQFTITVCSQREQKEYIVVVQQQEPKKSFFARYPKISITTAFLASVVIGFKIAAHFHDKGQKNKQLTGVLGLIHDMVGDKQWTWIKFAAGGGFLMGAFTQQAVSMQTVFICIGLGFLNGAFIGAGGMWMYQRVKKPDPVLPAMGRNEPCGTQVV